MTKTRGQFILMGLTLGTYDGWDALDDAMSIQLFQFKPAAGIPLPQCEALVIDANTGIFEAFDEHNDSTKYDLSLKALALNT